MSSIHPCCFILPNKKHNCPNFPSFFTSAVSIRRTYYSTHAHVLLPRFSPILRAPPVLSAQGEPVKPPPEKSFIQKYWLYIASALVFLRASSTNLLCSCVAYLFNQQCLLVALRQRRKDRLVPSRPPLPLLHVDDHSCRYLHPFLITNRLFHLLTKMPVNFQSRNPSD